MKMGKKVLALINGEIILWFDVLNKKTNEHFRGSRTQTEDNSYQSSDLLYQAMENISLRALMVPQGSMIDKQDRYLKTGWWKISSIGSDLKS